MPPVWGGIRRSEQDRQAVNTRSDGMVPVFAPCTNERNSLKWVVESVFLIVVCQLSPGYDGTERCIHRMCAATYLLAQMT